MPHVPPPEEFGTLMVLSTVAVLCGIVFLVGLFAIVGDKLGAKVPRGLQTAVGLLNLAAAGWWIWGGFFLEGLYFVSALVQATLGLLALALRRRPAAGS